MELILDIGGTKIAAFIVKNKRIVYQRQLLHHDFLNDLKSLLTYFASSYEFQGIAYSIAGHVKRNFIVKSPNLHTLDGFDLVAFTKHYFPHAKVVVVNDANCFAYGEAKIRKVKDVFLGIVWGTGVGAGIIINQKIIKGYEGIAGELGHLKLNHSFKCSCGKKGCLEAAIGGKSLELRLQQEVKTLISQQYSVFIKETLPWLSDALEKIIHLLNPKHIVFGGSIGENLPLQYLQELRKSVIQKLSFRASVDLDVSSSTSQAVIEGCRELLTASQKVDGA